MQTLYRFGLASVLLAATTVAAWAQAPGRREGDLKVGDAAPDFTVQDVQGKTTVRLSELRGRPVILLFGSCT